MGEVVLKTENLKDKKGRVHNINMEVRKGEIVGISGLVGAGKTELCKTLFGEFGKVEGTYEVCGKTVNPVCPADAIKAGLALIPEERRKRESSLRKLLITICQWLLWGNFQRF